MMVKVWLYAYMVGIHSSRKLERASREDVGFRVLSANQRPDHWTLSEFRRRRHEALGDLFDQTVEAAAKVGLVKLNHVSVDGTKDDRLRKDIERWFEEVEANDRAEDELYGKESGWELPPEPADTQKRREFIGKFTKELEDRKKAGNAGSEGPAKDKEQAYPPREKNKPAAPENQTRLVFPNPPRGRVRHPSVRRGKSPPSPRTRTGSTSPIRTRGS